MQFLKYAARVAATSECAKQHAAIVFKGGAVQACASNTPEDHAEVRALNNMFTYGLEDMDHLTLLSIRLSRQGLLRNAKPCINCVKYMREHGVKTVLYSTETGEIERMRL